jgi:dipeptidyl aminopeptidase/acylaminoacyl peptidase
MLPRPSSLGSGITLLLTLIVSLASPEAVHGQDLRSFTIDDALGVRSASIGDVTDDARWVAATIRTGRSGLNRDHLRYGDPTYISPSRVEVVVIDTEDGSSRSLFNELVNVRGLAWSPDGNRLAFLRYVDDAVRLEIWNREAGDLRRIRLQPERELAWSGSLEWLPDGSGLLVHLRGEGWAEEARAAYEAMEFGPVVVQDSSEPFLAWEAVTNRSALTELATVDLGTGAVRTVAEEARYQSVRISPDGSHLTYDTSTPLETSYGGGGGTEYGHYRLPLAEGAEPEEVMEKGERRLRLSWSPDGSVFVFSREGDIFLKAPGADSARNLTEDYRVPLSESDSTKRSFSLQRWHPESESLLLRSQDGYYLMDIEGGEPELLWPFPGDTRQEWGEGPQLSINHWTEDGRYLYATRSLRDRWERGLVRFDVERREEEILVADTDVYGSWTIAEDGSRIVFSRGDGDRPDDLWVAEGDFSDDHPITDLNPWTSEVGFAESRLIKYLDADGDELYGVLHVPPGYEEGTAIPLVAWIYETYFNNGFNSRAQLLAAQGWMVLRPSVDLEIGYPGEAWLKGVTAAINTLIDEGMVDGRRLGVHGSSYGGYATNLLITQTDRFAAAINISGKVNIISFLGDSEKIDTRNYNAAERSQDRIGATLWEQPQKYIAHSAVMFADRIDTPLLLLTGHGDWNVPHTNTREMYYALRRLGKEVVWVHYMRGGHGAGRASTEEDYYDHWNRMFDWYRTHFEKALEDDEGG